MKLKYYLRGLGLGILVTTLLLCLMGSGRTEELSDAQIRERALALGMVDGSALKLSELQTAGQQNESKVPQTGDESPQQTPDDKEADVPESSQEPGDGDNTPDTGEADAQQNTEEQGQDVGTSGDGSQQTPQTTEPDDNSDRTPQTEEPDNEDTSSAAADTMQLTISGGSGSYTVSRKLEEAGLVEDAQEFDDYLCDNGYSKRLRAGTFQIPVGASWEEIAGIITGK